MTWHLGKLDWKTATGDYVELTASVPADFPDAAATMLHVARTLTVSDEPIRLPVYFRGLPAGLGAIDFSLPTDSPALPIVYSPGLSMGIGVSDEDEFDVLVTTVNSPDDADRPKDTVCKVENGPDICVYNVPASLAKIGAKGPLNDIVSLGTNPANWTTDVVR
ncbi:MAG TPA: hypothetical protein VGX23_04675 [Actinocrinis sp.]|nr:hypothetical protein [Actinocrinis sp.]